MATYYFGAYNSGSLDDVLNYFTDELLETPAGLVPGVDDMTIGSALGGAGYPTSGTCVAIYDNQYIIPAESTAVFQNQVYAHDADSGTSIDGGTFNGPVGCLEGSLINGGTFNALVEDASGGFASKGTIITGGTFTATSHINFPAQQLTLGTADSGYGDLVLQGAITIGTYDYILEFTPDYPDADDVRVGIEYGDEQTGTLDLPAESDVRDGVTFDGETKEGTLGGGTVTITVE